VINGGWKERLDLYIFLSKGSKRKVGGESGKGKGGVLGALNGNYLVALCKKKPEECSMGDGWGGKSRRGDNHKTNRRLRCPEWMACVRVGGG